jgi:glutathione S-transferase
MLTLFFGPGACSLASHIALEEIGVPYEERPTLLAKGEQKSEAYLKVNPRGKVPALVVDGHVITENTAILTYLAKRYPEKQLWPTDPIQEAHCIGTMAWFSNSVHPCYTHYVRPERFVEGEAAQASVKEMGKQAFWAVLSEIDTLLGTKTWMLGDQFTVADCYAIVFYSWGVRAGLPMGDLKRYTAWKDRMLARPAVRRTLENEKNVLVQPA